MKILPVTLLAVFSVLVGCSDVADQPVDTPTVGVQRIDACSYQSAVWSSDFFYSIYADSSANCTVIRDGRDELRMSVNLQRLSGGTWLNIPPTTTTAKKTIPAGVSTGNVNFSHIKAETFDCQTGRYRVRTVIRSYRNGTTTVYQTTTHFSPEEVIEVCAS